MCTLKNVIRKVPRIQPPIHQARTGRVARRRPSDVRSNGSRHVGSQTYRVTRIMDSGVHSSPLPGKCS